MLEVKNIDRIKLFEREINYINNLDYRESVKKLLLMVPDYFFEVPASSTGKYHPSFSLGDGGLVRHTKVALKIGYDLLGLENYKRAYSSDERDLMLIAIMFHDTMKLGMPREEYTRFDHPLLAAKFIIDNASSVGLNEKCAKLISDCISSHMGEWNVNSYSDVVLPKPKSKYQIFVHMCDYLASRKFLDVKFVDNNIVL